MSPVSPASPARTATVLLASSMASAVAVAVVVAVAASAAASVAAVASVAVAAAVAVVAVVVADVAVRAQILSPGLFAVVLTLVLLLTFRLRWPQHERRVRLPQAGLNLSAQRSAAAEIRNREGTHTAAILDSGFSSRRARAVAGHVHSLFVKGWRGLFVVLP